MMLCVLLSGASESLEKADPNSSANPPVAQKHQATSQKNKTINKTQPPKVGETPSESAIVKALNTLIEKEDIRYKQEKAEENRWWPITPSWAIVYVTIIYATIAFFQLRAIARQGDIAERNITHLERPWLIVKHHELDNWGIYVDARNPGAPFDVRVRWSATNFGRSPAFLINVFVSLICMPFPIPSEQPNYERFRDFAEYPIPPNDSHSSESWLTITDEDVKEIKAHKRCIVFYGLLKYNDPIAQGHTTRFCSYWHMQNTNQPLTFVPVGPRSYIEYT